MPPTLRLAIVAMALAPAGAASAQDLQFDLFNDSSQEIAQVHASPTDVDGWEEDILGTDTLPPGAFARVILVDGRSQCVYDLRIVTVDADVLQDTADLCETGSYTVTD